MKRLLQIIILLALTINGVNAQIKQQRISIKPVGDRVVLKSTLVLDHVRLRSNQQHVYTPVLEGANGETALFQSIVVNGRRQHLYHLRNGNKLYPEAREVERQGTEAQRIDYLSSVAYEPWMDNATLRLNTDTCGCGNLVGQNEGEKLPLNFHPERDLCYAFEQGADGDDPIVKLSGKAYLDYPVNRTELHPDYRNNPRELQKIIATIDTVRHNDKVTITAIGIHGYASPEGPWDNNVRLSKGRAATLKEYVRRLYRFDDALFTVNYTPEDWAGLDSFLVESNLEHRDEILAIVRDESLEPDPRNELIKARYPEEYKFIHATWYPALRHSDYTVEFKIRPMSDAEAAELLHTQPQLLSLRKLYRIANLYEPGSDAYNEVFEIAVRMYPADPVANLNAANIELQRGMLDAAEKYLAKAGDTPRALHSRGILALLQHRFAEARQLLEAAQKAGVSEAAKNLEILQKMQEMSELD